MQFDCWRCGVVERAIGGDIATLEGIAEDVGGRSGSKSCKVVVQDIAIYRRGVGGKHYYTDARVSIIGCKRESEIAGVVGAGLDKVAALKANAIRHRATIS